MKKKIAWITDSTASLSEEFINEHNIHVVPLSIIFGNESFKENVDITDETFYQKLKESKELPKSSQPAIGDFIALYENLKKEYETAIAIHCSSKLSGTLQTSISAAEIAGFDVSFIDSKIGSYPMAKIIEKGIHLYHSGIPAMEIVKHLQTMTGKTQLFFSPSNMEQLHKSGRVTGTQAILGNLLKIKIILGFEDGSVTIKDKVRSEKKAKSALYDYLAKDLNGHTIEEVAIVHCNNPETAHEWKLDLESDHPDIKFVVLPFIPVVGVHTGSGTVGLSWIKN